MNLNSALQKADRLLEQKNTGSQYDQNQQWTLLSQYKLAFTGRNIVMAVEIQRDIQKTKKPGATLFQACIYLLMSSKAQSSSWDISFNVFIYKLA